MSRVDAIEEVIMNSADELEKVVKVQNDAHQRFRQATSGKMEWGSGSAAPDTNLYRSTANTLATDDALSVTGLLTATAGLSFGASDWKLKVEKVAFGATELTGSEVNTSFTFTANTLLLYAFIDVDDAESGTIDVGTQGTSNDPDGILDGISVSTLGIIAPNVVTTAGLNETYISAMTFGALTHYFKAGADDAGETGVVSWRPTVITAADPVSITSSGDLDSCSGNLYLVMLVPTA